MPKKNYTPFRQVVGEYLNQRRKELGLTMYQFKKNSGLSHGQANAIFAGDKSYTIDSLFAAIEVLDCYFYFAARDNKSGKMDETDFFDKMMKNDPEK